MARHLHSADRPAVRDAFAPTSPLAVLVIAALGAAFALPCIAEAQSARSASITSAMHWRSIGPWIGGRCVAVTGVPGEDNLFYMGAVDGGVWKSTDYGVQWENITEDSLPGTSQSVGAVAVAPSDHDVLYVGTGEYDIRGDMITGDGVFRSADGGKSWREAGLAETHTISGLIVDPNNPDVVYASSMGHVFEPDPNRGVFKSTDGGRTWRKVLFVSDSTGAIDLVMDPTDPQHLFAAMWQAYRKPWRLSSGGEGSGLYESTDGGAHWTDITHRPGLPKEIMGRMGIGVSASNPNIVYATIQARDGGVFKSTDGGSTWARVNDDWKLRQRAFYYETIYVDPRDPDTVYMPEVDALYVSHDGGKNFTRLRTPHGDNHVLWINPEHPDILLEGNDGGATVSTDAGKTWSTEHNQPTGQFYKIDIDHRFPFHIYGAQQDEGAFEGPSAHPGGSIPLAAWKRAAYGESTPSVPEPGHPDVTYGSGYFSIFLRYDQSTGQYRSVSPWPYYHEGASSGELEYRFAWTHPVLFSPADSTELLTGSQYVHVSHDHGMTWKTISPDLTRDDSAMEAPTGGPIDLDQSGAEIFPYVSALSVSPMDGELIWAGSSDGLVHVTRDGGRNWTTVTPPDLPKYTRIADIEPSHVDEGTAYLAARRYMWDDFTPYVFRTTDYGAHWTEITDGLPKDEYVFAVRQDPDDADLLFAGTKSTVYVSLDGGAHWQPLSLDLPAVQVRDIAIDTRQGDVAIATHGRSFWVLDGLHVLEQLTGGQPAMAGPASLYAPQTAWLSHAYGSRSGGEGGPLRAGENPPFGATVYFQVPDSYDGSTPVSLTFTDASGEVVRSFDLHPKKKEEKKSEVEKEKERTRPSAVQRREALQELTGIEPGANHFQWDLRYPDATEVEGFLAPVAAGGLEDEVEGPVVTPGTYHVVLSYGGQKAEQSFQVKLDPRLDATQADLEAELKLQLSIHRTLDSLDRALNRAIDVRDGLEKAIAGGSAKGGARKAVSALSDEIGRLVQLDIHSSEGDLLHQARLRSHLAYLAADIGLAYARPTPAHEQVFRELQTEARKGEQKLEGLVQQAKGMM